MILAYAYFLLTLLVMILLISIGSVAIKRSISDRKKIKLKIVLLTGGLLLWQIYIYIVASTGILQDFNFPPKFVLFLVLPAFIFTGIFIGLNRKKNWITQIPEQWLIYFQSFRIIVETLFVFSVTEGVLHNNVTIEGYNYDMIMGLSAPIIAYLVFNANWLPRRALLLWNYLGLVVLASVIFVFTSTIFLPEIYGETTNLMPKEFGAYPYVTVAGFLMPVAVFMHILSIVQLKRNGL